MPVKKVMQRSEIIWDCVRKCFKIQECKNGWQHWTLILGPWEDKAEKFNVQGLTELQSKIKANLNNLARTYLKSNV